MKWLESIGRITAVFLKELHQMRRDRLTFAMMFGIPIVQLILFGFAINTDPKSLPTAVYVAEPSPLVRDLISGMESSGYFRISERINDSRAGDGLLSRGEVAFVVSFPAGFTRDFVRGARPQVLVEADASDPAASSNAIARLESIFLSALQYELSGALAGLKPKPPPFELIVHAKYNPEGVTQYNIVPGLLGVILTLTMVMITAISMAREVERGTMENLLALPARPYEVMVGKIAPYIAIGFIQTLVVLAAARYVFLVPFAGSFFVLLLGISVFMLANLALGFTFSTFARSQLQAMQLTFFFFLPSIMLSGFMFPFRGMPEWAQTLGEIFPLTHFLRIIRGVMLKGSEFANLQTPLLMMLAFTAIVGTLAMLRYRRTLD
jgi:ABC-2 type transport system permease protein